MVYHCRESFTDPVSFVMKRYPMCWLNGPLLAHFYFLWFNHRRFSKLSIFLTKSTLCRHKVLYNDTSLQIVKVVRWKWNLLFFPRQRRFAWRQMPGYQEKFKDYIAITLPYVTSDWKLGSKLLNFKRFVMPHTGDALATRSIYSVILSREQTCLIWWERKLASMTRLYRSLMLKNNGP